MTDQIAIDFERFHLDNPQVYRLFNRFATMMIHRGRTHGSAKLIFERIRWEHMFAYDLDDTRKPKLNNNYTALYARRWEELNPEHKGFFRKRVRRANTSNSTEFAPADD